ncbi:hypothetical protein [Microbacterium sp. NPDC090014]|uniref:hypothetical protein n=1 Tax=Microbacterium sp. NPDC090014 TaxID=3364205 RepID=UPI00381BDBCA
MTDSTRPEDPQYSPPAWDGARPADAAVDPAAYPMAGAGQPTPYTSPAGQGLAVAGLVLAFVIAPLGLILSIVAAVRLGKAGAPRGLAIAGIAVGAVISVIWIIGIIVLVSVFANLFSMCADLGPGVWQVGGVTYTCS